jgi:hypothetical protein
VRLTQIDGKLPNIALMKIAQAVAIRLLQGRPVVALTDDTASIRNPATGTITTYRKHNKPGCDLAGLTL